MTLTELEKLLRDLVSLKHTPLEERIAGICYYTSLWSSCSYAPSIFQKWPKFSGCTLYPIKAPFIWRLFGLTPKEAFELLPKWKGSYGRARQELLDFMIECVTNDIVRLQKGKTLAD